LYRPVGAGLRQSVEQFECPLAVVPGERVGKLEHAALARLGHKGFYIRRADCAAVAAVKGQFLNIACNPGHVRAKDFDQIG